MDKIAQSLFKLSDYIERSNYKGYDPYDALLSPLFKLPVLNKSKLIRFGSQQFVKRCPVNLRKLLLVPKGYNPVTLGLCIQGYAYLCEVYPENRQDYIKRIEFLISELENLISSGFSGACWGYDFDWEARYAKIPAYQPNVVSTGIISNALFECWKITKIQRCAELVVSSSKFVLNDLNRTFNGETFCYSYSPFDKQSVYNASLKGVRILSQTYNITHNESLLKDTFPAVEFVFDNQNGDGSFNYSKAGKWIDNYHSGYVLDCLDVFIQSFNQYQFQQKLKKSYSFYTEAFFTLGNIPKFYSTEIYPVDCTAASQSILTLCRFGDIKKARQAAVWMINNMQAKDGSFYFRKFKTYTIKTSFMRWSNAWMFASLAYLLFMEKKHNL